MSGSSRLSDYAKWGTVLLGVVTLAVSSHQFFRAKSLEREDQFNTYQLALYQEVSELAATLASSKVQATRDSAWQRFQAHYWGEMVLVESPEVESWMSRFKSAYEGRTTGSLPHPFIRSFAYCLARALRQDLAETWRIDHWTSDQLEPGAPDSCEALGAAFSAELARLKVTGDEK